MFTIDLKITKPAPARRERAATFATDNGLDVVKSPKLPKLPKAETAKPKKARKPRPQRAAGVSLGKWASVGKGRSIRVASPELSGEAGIAEVGKLIAELTAAGCQVETDEGLYVRIKEELTAADLSKVAINAMWFEAFLSAVAGDTGRDDAKSNRSAFGGTDTAALNAGIAILNAAAKSGSAGDVVDALQMGDDAFKVNLVPYLETGAVEFRHHAGSFDADAIGHWLRVCEAMVAKAKTSRPRSRGVEKAWTAAEEGKLFFQIFSLPAETRAYCTARAAA